MHGTKERRSPSQKKKKRERERERERERDLESMEEKLRETMDHQN